MTERTLRGRTAIVGIGETTYYRHGQSPNAEFKLALQAVVNACKDAGISPHDIDGFASYGNDRSEAGRLASALGIKELRFSNMFWGGGGGGVCGAVGFVSDRAIEVGRVKRTTGDQAASRMRSATIPRVRKRWRRALVGRFRLRRERACR